MKKILLLFFFSLFLLSGCGKYDEKDVIKDFSKKVNDTEELNDVTLTNIEVQSNGNICVNVANASQAEIEYFNVALSYIIANPKSEP